MLRDGVEANSHSLALLLKLHGKACQIARTQGAVEAQVCPVKFPVKFPVKCPVRFPVRYYPPLHINPTLILVQIPH